MRQFFFFFLFSFSKLLSRRRPLAALLQSFSLFSAARLSPLFPCLYVSLYMEEGLFCFRFSTAHTTFDFFSFTLLSLMAHQNRIFVVCFFLGLLKVGSKLGLIVGPFSIFLMKNIIYLYPRTQLFLFCYLILYYVVVCFCITFLSNSHCNLQRSISS